MQWEHCRIEWGRMSWTLNPQWQGPAMHRGRSPHSCWFVDIYWLWMQECYFQDALFLMIMLVTKESSWPLPSTVQGLGCHMVEFANPMTSRYLTWPSLTSTTTIWKCYESLKYSFHCWKISILEEKNTKKSCSRHHDKQSRSITSTTDTWTASGNLNNLLGLICFQFQFLLS